MDWIIKKSLQFGNVCWRIFHRHCSAYLVDLDPIRDLNPTKKKKNYIDGLKIVEKHFSMLKNSQRILIPHYTFPLALFLPPAVDMFINLLGSLGPGKAKSNLIMYKIFSHEFEELGNVIICVSLIVPLMTYFNLSFFHLVSGKFLMFSIQERRKSSSSRFRLISAGGKELPQELGHKLMKFRRKAKKIAKFLIPLACAQKTGFHFTQFLRNRSDSVLDLIGTVIYVPIFLGYLSFGKTILYNQTFIT